MRLETQLCLGRYLSLMRESARDAAYEKGSLAFFPFFIF